ncbi:hypothetical protein OCK74_08465 [Chitinophagaceae bacterium LB-8]|uniref:Uncharacterized protein n=1 Tax=Paraflavisolibacter caeni TaxID=2982496 RepID=A0A9X2XUZ1_9BACT|nr:hypothetical protein [Paraflavisolibacter caeni]MCU7549145.1 hypothetical protein [Paraflavisolibacter caeni]
MDSRKTLVVTETFRQILLELHEAKEKASLLYDDDGLTRADDFIQEYKADGDNSYILLENGQKILINRVIAVNGTFLSQYSEC